MTLTRHIPSILTISALFATTSVPWQQVGAQTPPQAPAPALTVPGPVSGQDASPGPASPPEARPGPTTDGVTTMTPEELDRQWNAGTTGDSAGAPVPIRGDGEDRLGTMVFLHPEAGYFTDDDVRLARSIGASTGVAGPLRSKAWRTARSSSSRRPSASK